VQAVCFAPEGKTARPNETTSSFYLPPFLQLSSLLRAYRTSPWNQVNRMLDQLNWAELEIYEELAWDLPGMKRRPSPLRSAKSSPKIARPRTQPGL
jgi:hypothetical protein